MRGKLMFVGGLAAGFVLGTKAGRERYEELVQAARKVREHPTVQEATGVVQSQASKLYAGGKEKLSQTRLGRGMNDRDLTSATTAREPASGQSDQG